MKYFLIGIKGSGMASLAQILLDLNFEVSGSDIENHIFTQDILQQKNVDIKVFSKDNIKEGMIIVKGNSFNEDHEEVKQARKLNLKVYTYVEMLQKLIEDYYSICIAGTHGKTTTTGLVTSVLQAQEKTGYLIGDGHGQLHLDDTNFIVESCEYQDNFLNYHCDIALINNIELDHVDYFHSLEQYIDSFKQFSLQAKKYVVLNGDDLNCLKIETKDNYYYFGLNDNNNFQAKNIIHDTNGFSFDLYTDFNLDKKEFVYRFNINLFGEHMLLNTLATISIYALKHQQFNYQDIERQLNLFKGVARRFEIIEQNSNVFIDDYAHHPTAISYMIDTVKIKYPDKKVIAFFKPDRYSRIAQFQDEIALALNKADEVYLFDFPSTSVKEEGIEVTMDNVLSKMNKGKLILENQESALLFQDYKDSVFLLMSSKNVYDFEKVLIESINN